MIPTTQSEGRPIPKEEEIKRLLQIKQRLEKELEEVSRRLRTLIYERE